MNNLKKSIMGTYNAADVDALLLKVRNDYERCLKEQKDRIFRLREENKELSLMLEKYKSSERYIIGAITKAEETAQSIIGGAEREARGKLEKAEREQKQILMAIEGCCQRLYKLKRASEAIYRAVSKVIGEHEEEDKTVIQSKIRAIKPVAAVHMSD